VTTSPTLSGLHAFPSSGAIPGPTKCPSGYYPYGNGTYCTKHGDVPVFLDEPIVAVPTGTVLAYRAILGADWTNATPSAAGSAQSIPVQ
jgi:hypothetical protein